ncbi:alpha-hydroxy acid oxidase [Rhodovulum sp. YNF3179]|uniref:alpha-hydroxy acid oxidase n=1 Tax=Rhodovulum sp. YNF3179 TaxID=3425127 RepID=UPI003D33C53F
MDLDLSHPALSDLKASCRRRVPGFVWEYVDSATGTESVKTRNRAALDAVTFLPAILRGQITPDLTTRLLGRDCALPVGIAPVGMSGLIWPGAEQALARLAAAEGIPYTLSTVATRLPEEVGPLAGDQGWFQLYPPTDPEIRRDILRRAREAGFHTLVMTADLPGPSRRERQRRARLTIPPRLTPGMVLQMMLRPRWSLATLQNGVPRLRLMESYLETGGAADSTGHAGYLLRAAPDWDYLAAVRADWEGPLVVKGVMEPADAARMKETGIDAVWVSNHTGRQFDGAPAALTVLPAVRAAVGPDYPLIFDGGVESGLDILRALAFGADFVMLGRGFHYAMGAFGATGAAHLVHILREDLVSNMVQMGITRPGNAASRLSAPPPATA